MRNKSVRKTRGVGARFTGRGSYVSRIFTNAASKQIYRGIGTRYFHHAREREDFSRDSIARFISIAGENKGRG